MYTKLPQWQPYIYLITAEATEGDGHQFSINLSAFKNVSLAIRVLTYWEISTNNNSVQYSSVGFIQS